MTARAALAVAALAAAACQVQGGPPLQVLTETARPRWRDDLPATSAIFDGATVRLRGARGEVLGVEVLRPPADAVDVALTVADADVRGFAVDHAVVASPSTAMYGTSRGAGRYPDRLTPVAGPVATPRMAYFDVAIPIDATAGLHRGELVVGDQRFAVELTVEPIALPAVDDRPWVWAYYNPNGSRASSAATTPTRRSPPSATTRRCCAATA
ncbi:MAG: hypothetical protein IPH44_24390 [Myxococcales bacterium]|nr:hypothetical protein [Myxococcales bacterium]